MADEVTSIALSAATVRKWLEEDVAPSGPAFAALVDRYGVALLCAVYPERRKTWYADEARRRAQAHLEAQAVAIHRQLADVLRGTL